MAIEPWKVLGKVRFIASRQSRRLPRLAKYRRIDFNELVNDRSAINAYPGSLFARKSICLRSGN